MISQTVLKEAYEVSSKHGAFFTGGHVAWTNSGEELLCQCEGVIKVVDVEQGKVKVVLGKKDEADEDTITTFTLSEDNEMLISSHKSGLFRLWNWRDGDMLKLWKSIHKGPVANLVINHTNVLLASGGSDSCVRIWNLQHQSCTLCLRGAQGVFSVLEFDSYRGYVFGAADDLAIRAWDSNSGKQALTLKGHFSKVTSLKFHRDTQHLVSCGRDKVVILWELEKGTSIRTLPLYEGLEGLVILPASFTLPGLGCKMKDDTIHIAAAGERGVVRVWELICGKEIYQQTNSLVSKATEDGCLAVTHLLFNESRDSFAIVSVDHNILIHKLDTFHCTKQLIGFSHEILDVVFLGVGDSHIAVASNSRDIKLYRLLDMNCQLLQGHTDLVLALATTPSNQHLLVSAGKDNTVRLWLMDPETEKVAMIGVGARHTASVGTAALSCSTSKFLVSASQDCCLKLWKLPATLDHSKMHELSAKYTEMGHERDINSICVSPNDKLVATGSQDKTAKLWSSKALSLMGVLRGHKRGVWCVRFSPVDQLLATSSADCTVRLWSISDLTCFKTMEGHDASVLRVDFITRGMQLISAGADGLLKLWVIKTGECVTTLDHHQARVWALAVSEDGAKLVSGGSDSELAEWRDVTEEKRDEADQARQKLALQDQELSNLLHSDDLLAALKLAIALDRPMKVLHIVKEVLRRGESGLGDSVKQLQQEQKETLLRFATTWNTNSRNCHPAQVVFTILLDELLSGTLKPDNLASTIQAALPYSERHFKRLTTLLQGLHFLKYTAACMQPHAK